MEVWIASAIISFLCCLLVFIVVDSWQIAAFVSLISSIITGSIAYTRLNLPRMQGKLPLPPTPPAWPILGHIHLLGTRAHESLHRLSQKYGPVLFLRLGSIQMAVITSPEMVREFLKVNDARFAFRPQTILFNYISYNFQDIVLAPYGPRWQHMRKICALELLSARRSDSFRELREEQLIRLLYSIWEHGQVGGGVNIRGEVWSLMYNTISRMIMGKRFSCRSLTQHMFRQRIESATQLSVAFHVGDYFPSLRWLDFQGRERRIKEIMTDLDAAASEIVDKHKSLRNENSGSAPKDIIDVLLGYCEGAEADANGMLTDTNVKAVIFDLYAAATDTTAVTTEWAFAELLRWPRVMEKTLEELDFVVGRDRRVLESDLLELPYLAAVVKETLRLHPAVPLLVPHQNEEACSVAGYFIPAKTRVVANLWAIGRDARVWKDPLEFNPERFMGDNNNVDMKGQDLHFIPFGTGRRMCPGLSLGFLMSQMALASLIHSFTWSLPPEIKGLDMSEAFGGTLPRAKPLIAFPRPRLSSSSIYSAEDEGPLQQDIWH